ncbi:MAG: T9SS type A sorting domain-containing protein, partial [Vicingaceae bacterium]
LVESEQNVSIQLFNVLGKLTIERKLSENSNHNLNLTELQQGIYFYRLLDGSNVQEHGKLIIK